MCTLYLRYSTPGIRPTGDRVLSRADRRALDRVSGCTLPVATSRSVPRRCVRVSPLYLRIHVPVSVIINQPTLIITDTVERRSGRAAVALRRWAHRSRRWRILFQALSAEPFRLILYRSRFGSPACPTSHEIMPSVAIARHAKHDAVSLEQYSGGPQYLPLLKLKPQQLAKRVKKGVAIQRCLTSIIANEHRAAHPAPRRPARSSCSPAHP